MKFRLITLALALLAGTAVHAQKPEAYTLANCISILNETQVRPTRAGWENWFVPKGFGDTLTIKMSAVSLLPGTHDPHSHNEDEAFLLVQGPAIVHINGEERELQTGDFFYTPSGSSHSLRRAGEGPIRYLVIKRETTTALDKPFEVSKPNYTYDDCIFQPGKDAAWMSGAPGRVIAIDEHFSNGLRVAMRRVTKDDVAFQSQEPHAHTQEVIYILSGEAEITLAGEGTIRVRPQTSFYCPPGVMHSIKQVGEEPMVFLAIITY